MSISYFLRIFGVTGQILVQKPLLIKKPLILRIGSVRIRKNSPHQDPSASGMPASITRAPAYIGCLTIAYGPVEMTF